MISVFIIISNQTEMQEDNFQPLLSGEDYQELLQKGKKLRQLQQEHKQKAIQTEHIKRELVKCSRIINIKQSYIQYIKNMVLSLYQSQQNPYVQNGENQYNQMQSQFINLQEQDFEQLTEQIQNLECKEFFKKQQQLLKGIKQRIQGQTYYITKLQEQIQELNAQTLSKINKKLQQKLKEARYRIQEIQQEKITLLRKTEQTQETIICLSNKIQDIANECTSINSKLNQKDIECKKLSTQKETYWQSVINHKANIQKLQQIIKKQQIQQAKNIEQHTYDLLIMQEKQKAIQQIAKLKELAQQKLQVLTIEHYQLLQNYKTLKRQQETQTLSFTQQQQQKSKLIQQLEKMIQQLGNSLNSKQQQIKLLKYNQQKKSKGQKSYRIKQLVLQYKQELEQNLKNMGGLHQRQVSEIIENQFKTLSLYISQISKQ